MGKQRPREHTIEQEAERAISAHLDPWAITRCTDYGRDLNVELFTAPDQATPPSSTGILFDIQIKATDSAKPEKAKQQFKVKDLLYFEDNGLPVLICLYYAQEKQIYSRWAQTINIKRDQKMQTVYFEEAAWNASIKKLLRDDLDWIRSLQSHTSLPCIIYIDDSELAQVMEDYWADTNILRVTSVPHMSNLRPGIRATDNQLHINFGVTSFTFHIDDANIPRDITTAVVIMLLRYGYDGQAAALLKKILRDLSPLSPNMIWLLGNEDYHNLYTFCHRMVLCDQIDILCRLLRAIYISFPSTDDVCEVYDMLGPEGNWNIDFGDMTRYTDSQILVFRDIIGDYSTLKMANIVEHIFHYVTTDQLSEIFYDWSNLPHAALCWLGESYLSLGELERASEALTSATGIGDMGMDHPTVRRLTGLIAAAEARTDDAIRELDCAHQLGDMQASFLALLVLIDNGQYAEALKHMTTDEDTSDGTEGITGADADEVFLLANVLDHIVKTTGVKGQDRDTLQAIEATYLLEQPLESSQEQYEKYFRQAFDADIAWGSVWFNHATMLQAQLHEGLTINEESIALDYLSAAVLCYIDAEAWICAMVTIAHLAQKASHMTLPADDATEPTESLLLQATIRTALRLTGPKVIETLHRLPVVTSLDNPVDVRFSSAYMSTAITQKVKDAIIEILDIFVNESPLGQGFLWMWPTLTLQRVQRSG